MALERKHLWWIGGAVFLAVAIWKRKAIAAAGSAAGSAVAAAGSAVAEDIRGIKDKVIWAKTMYESIQRVLPQVSFTGRLIIIAQAINEGGWTGGRAAKAGFNYWNLTTGPAWKGEVFVDVNGDRSYQRIDCERQGRPMNLSDAHGSYCRIDQRWRKYPNLDAAVLDFWGFIGNKRYTGAQAALQDGDIRRYVDILGDGGYYDAAVRELYYSNLTSIVKSVQKRVS
jgi:flagellum-specific peptidoglycan hydrolase FlgJ